MTLSVALIFTFIAAVNAFCMAGNLAVGNPRVACLNAGVTGWSLGLLFALLLRS